MYDDLVEFLQESVTPFHAAAIAESWLRAAGFTRLEEADYWNLEPGKGYYTTPQRLVRCGVARAAARHRRLAHRGQPQRPPVVENQPTPLKTTVAAA